MELALLLAFAFGMFLTTRSMARNSTKKDKDISSGLLITVMIVSVLSVVGVSMLFTFV